MAYQIVKSAGGVPESSEKVEVLIESSSDLANLPESISPGSVAYTASLTLMYMKDIDGTWTQIGGGGG